MLPDPLVVDTLATGDRALVLERYPDDWVKVRTDNGNIGYAYGKKLFLGMPDPESRVHLIRPGQTALGIAQEAYNCGEWGSDGRFFVNVLVAVNSAAGDPGERKGIFKKEGTDTDAVDSWKDAELLAGYWIWLPGEAFARSLAGTVSSGSVSFEAWQAVEGLVGFAVGILDGIATALADLVMGLVDLAGMIVDLVLDVARNGIAAKVGEVRDFFDKLDVAEVATALWQNFEQQWNAPDGYDRWRFRGVVVGTALAEIAMAVLSGGATVAVKVASKAGQLAKLAAKLLKLDAIVDFARGVDKAGDATDAGRAARKLLTERDPDLPDTPEVPGATTDPGMAGGAANANARVLLANQLRTADAAGPLLDSLRASGKLPANFVTKAQAEAAGWMPGKAIGNYVPGGQLGGDVFLNTTKVVPPAPGRIWFEADVGLVSEMTRAKQPGTRLLYSSDGLAYVTFDHYETAIQIPGWK
jgi:hypothetical protein